MKEKFCIDCDNNGYLTNVVSIGLKYNDTYLKPHIERCDICKIFKNDKQAKQFIDKRI